MCPPKDAVPIDGEFYRLCKNATPNIDDFITHYERNNIPRGEECRARALSFFESLEGAERLKNTVWKFKNYIPVTIKITPQHGIGKVDSKGHLDLWEYSGKSFIP